MYATMPACGCWLRGLSALDASCGQRQLSRLCAAQRGLGTAERVACNRPQQTTVGRRFPGLRFCSHWTTLGFTLALKIRKHLTYHSQSLLSGAYPSYSGDAGSSAYNSDTAPEDETDPREQLARGESPRHRGYHQHHHSQHPHHHSHHSHHPHHQQHHHHHSGKRSRHDSDMVGPPPASAPAPPPASEGQTYCLRWNNHQTNLVQILHALHEVGSYVDCTLVVDDDQFKAHRVVLAANSPYFQHILQDVPQDHCIIILPGVQGFEIAALLQYMYTGETTVTKSQEPEILRTAKELQVKGLYDNLMKFNQKDAHDDEPSAHHLPQPQPTTPHYASSTHLASPYAASASSAAAAAAAAVAAATASATCAATKNGAGSSLNGGVVDPYAGVPHNSSSVISTSTHISPTAAISSSSSPPYTNAAAAAAAAAAATSYQPPTYTNPYRKSPGPLAVSAAAAAAAGSAEQATTQSAGNPERAQWPLSPSAAAAAAMLNSVYESAADMNPLKRKKLSAISSMFLNRDTPILRNVLANPADSSQPTPLLLPGVFKDEKQRGDKQAPSTHNNNSFNGSDYGSEKYQDEPLSPHTDRSFDDESAGGGGGGGGNSGKKPEWKRYKQYTRNDMMCAIQCVREGMSALQASRKFGLPSRTLYDKVRKLNITTGRGTNRAPKRSPPSVDSSAAFPYHAAHSYGHAEPLLGSLHDARDEREPKEHHGHAHGHHGVHHRSSVDAAAHHMPPTIPHSAAALLDHAFLQQALENRGSDIAGREALHAMALAAAAHAAANRMSSSPGSNGHGPRTPSPAASRYLSAAPAAAGDELVESMQEVDEKPQLQHPAHMIKREALDEREERDADDEGEDHVEDLSVARKKRGSSKRPESPYSPPPPAATAAMSERGDSPLPTAAAAAAASAMEAGVIVPPQPSSSASSSSKAPNASNGGAGDADADDFESVATKRELLNDDGRAD